jgi:flagellar protein FliS
MYSANSRALNAYRSVGVETGLHSATPQQLILMLFDGARAAVSSARAHMQSGETAAKCKAISQAIAIVDGGLKASLDLQVGGELARNLSDLYTYMTFRLVRANIDNNDAALDEVARLLQQLGEAWASLAANPGAAKPADASPTKTSRVAATYGAR